MRTSSPRFIPAHFRDPLGLAWRVAGSGGSEGRFALLSVPLGVLAIPLDLALQPREKIAYGLHEAPSRPMALVCGPSRSGTSVVTAALIRTLPVGYVNNLMAAFPRSPLAANRLFRMRLSNERVGLKTYYGRTSGFSAQNDGLFLWDRWFGEDRTDPAPSLPKEKGRDMARFWAAFEAHWGRPIVAKNNSLVAFADKAAAYLPTARFLCLRRTPLYLAQSLLIARREIQGNPGIPYGLQGAERHEDPVKDVCRQVAFYEAAMRAQLATLGTDRFWIVSYEEFCRDPAALAHRVAERILGVEIRPERLRRALPPIKAHNERRLPDETFNALAANLRELGVCDIEGRGDE